MTRSAVLRRGLSLVALAALLIVPAPWGVPLLIIAIAGRVAIAAGRRLPAGRAARPEPGALVLGRDQRGRPVTLTDAQLEAHALIVGASGAGKSTTLQTILADQIRRGRPVVAIDMKGSPGFEAALSRAAAEAGRGLRVWSPDGPSHWNPLAHGNPTALKDKLISSERFSEPHYQRAAERYLQTAFTVLREVHPSRPATLAEVVAVMEPGRLAMTASRAPAATRQRVTDYLSGMTRDQLSAAAGLGTRLALLSESSAGRYLEPSESSAGRDVDLVSALQGGDVVLFSLNSSTYGKLAAQLGALAIQDLTSAAGTRLTAGGGSGGHGEILPATIALDEFSALGADNVLALLARGREAGVSVLLATQELADLERAAPGFRDQVLGITAVKLAHRQEVNASALTIAQLAGTERVWRETRQLPTLTGRAPASRGTRREVEELVVHPNEIKRLRTGQLVMFSSVPEPRVARTTVTPPATAPAVRRSPGSRRRDPDLGR